MAYTGYVGPTPSMCFCGHAALDHSILGTFTQTITGAYANNGTISATVNGQTSSTYAVTNADTPSTVAAALATRITSSANVQATATAVGPTIKVQVARFGSSPTNVVQNVSFSLGTTGFVGAGGATAGGCSYCPDNHSLGPEQSRVAGMTPNVLNKPN